MTFKINLPRDPHAASLTLDDGDNILPKLNIEAITVYATVNEPTRVVIVALPDEVTAEVEGRDILWRKLGQTEDQVEGSA